MSEIYTATGFPELFAKMDKLADEIGKAKTNAIWRKAMTFAMEPVLQDAKVMVPKDTNQLDQHIFMRVHRPQAIDKRSLYYAGESYMARVYVTPERDDTVRKVVLNKRGKFQTVLTNKKPVAVSQEFGNARVPPHPFLRPALNQNIEKVTSRLGQSVWSAIDILARK
jgi:HK97 gp10 family phage protein